MKLGENRGLTQAQARERLNRCPGVKLLKTNGNRKLYQHSGGTKHALWIDEKDGSVTLEEHDTRCDC